MQKDLAEYFQKSFAPNYKVFLIRGRTRSGRRLRPMRTNDVYLAIDDLKTLVSIIDYE